MESQQHDEAERPVTFGRRELVPRACIADAKKHIRAFLVEALEELGFITCECAHHGDWDTVLGTSVPNLVVLGMSAGGVEAAETVKILAAKKFDGRILILGPDDCSAVAAVHELCEELGFAILPRVRTPFSIESLRASLSALIPAEAPPNPPIDVAEAASAGWLELWYQPKIDVRTRSLSGAEALIRIHHPAWGIVPPGYFIPNDSDPHCRALHKFVIGRAVDDWRYFLDQYGHIEIAINLPISFFQDEESVGYLCRALPDHHAFQGLIIETNGLDILRNLQLVKDVARKLRFHKIAISVDDLGAEWPSLMELHDFPFVEVKVDPKFIHGCADDQLKRVVCRRILELADGFGARTVAEGVESRADFLSVCEMGFTQAQGFLFSKPMRPKRFLHSTLRHPTALSGGREPEALNLNP